MKRSMFCILMLATIFSACILYEPVINSTPQEPSIAPLETFTATATDIIMPTATHTATMTATLKPTVTLTPTKTVTATPVPFHLQSVTPVFLQNFVYPDSGCNCMGVGGQIFDKAGTPTANLVVWIRGVIDNQPFESIVLTGTTAGNRYGKAGFEAVLSSKPVATSAVFSIQILDLDGNVLSEQVFFNTSEQCDQNLIIINFVEE